MATLKVIMQGKLFQRCTYILYFSVLSLGVLFGDHPKSLIKRKTVLGSIPVKL